jgi:hypothetical protein
MIGVGIKRLIFFDETVTSDVYKLQCLQRVVVPTFVQHGKRHTFMHDGARVHTAGKCVKYLASKGVATLDWPPRSPDLNPIENLWGVLQKSVSDRGPRSVADLTQFVKEEWEAITQQDVDKFVLSFTSRTVRVVQRKGL